MRQKCSRTPRLRFAENSAALHRQTNLASRADVFCRIASQRDEVGQLTGADDVASIREVKTAALPLVASSQAMLVPLLLIAARGERSPIWTASNLARVTLSKRPQCNRTERFWSVDFSPFSAAAAPVNFKRTSRSQTTRLVPAHSAQAGSKNCFTHWLICFVVSLRYHLNSGKLLVDAVQKSLFTKSVIFKIVTLTAFIAWHASAATAHGAEVDRRTDRWLSLNEPSAKGSLVFAWGEHTASRIVETQTMFIRHTATELQRRIAEKNAKAYYAQLTPEKKDELKKKKIHYLAVPTVRSKETSPKAKEVLMIWDIPRESLVGQNVYELDKKPPLGTLASYDNLRAEYIGTVAGNP